MKKAAGWLARMFAVGSLVFLPGLAVAQDLPSTRAIPPYHDSFGDALLGEQQAMSVILRGNGTAVVLVRHVLSNPEAVDRNTASFTLPEGVEVESLAVYQFVLPATCLEYDYTFSLDANGVYPCKTYDDPDYQYPYFENGTATYSKLTPELNGQTLNFTLATPIAAQKNGGLLVSFRTKNFTRQRLGGLFSYSVTSLAVPDPITDVTLGIDVDTDDLILKGGTGRVDYNDLIYAAVDSPEQDIRANASGLDEALQIVGSGQLTKSASSLDAGETFTVQGSYGTSWLGLNLLPILLVVFVLLCLVGLTIWTTLRRKQLLAARSEHSLTFQSWWFEFWMSLLVASLAVGFTYLVSWLLGGLIYLNLNNGVATILIVVVTALIYCFLLLGFPLFVGLKRGWLRIFGSVLFEILWLVVIVVLLLYFTGSFENFMPIELS